MNRRKFLTIGSSVSLLSGCLTIDNKEEEEIECFVSFRENGNLNGRHLSSPIDEDKLTKAGVISGSGGPKIPYDNHYYSHVYWCPEELFSEINMNWVGAAPVGEEGGRKSRIFLNEDAPFINDYVIYHERGHNLGFTHDDGGIMDYQSPDSKKDYVSDTTRIIAENTEGLDHFEWDEESKRKFRKLWKKGKILDSDALYVFGRPYGSFDVYSDGTVLDSFNNIPEDMEIYKGGIYHKGNEYDGTEAWG